MRGLLNDLLAHARTWAEWFREHLWVLALIALAAAFLASEAGRFHAQRQAADYRKLWKTEQNAHRHAIDGRLSQIEAQVAALPEPEVPRAYQERLSVVRQRFDRVMRREANPVCPAVPVQAAPAPARVDVAPEPCPMTQEQADAARSDQARLAGLQAWVRENTGAGQ